MASDKELLKVDRAMNGGLKIRVIWEDALRAAGQITSTGQLKEYVHATSVNSPDYIKFENQLYRMVKDHLGSVRLVVNAETGIVTQRLDYNEWGKVTLDTNPRFQLFGFAGGLYDPDTKLVQFGARDYDGRTGRWLSKDPISFNGSDTNLYGYVQNDPVNFIDYNGKDKVAIAVGAMIVTYLFYKYVVDPNFVLIPDAIPAEPEQERPVTTCNPEIQSCTPPEPQMCKR